MKPIFNRQGKTVGWLSGTDILDSSNHYRAFVANAGNVYTYEGRHLGILDRGFFRDQQGYCVAFLDGAEGGPVAPIHDNPIEPIPPIEAIPARERIPTIQPQAPVAYKSWSSAGWEEFLAS